MGNQSLPPIKTLFSESWQSLSKSFGKLILLSLLSFLPVFILMVILAVIVVALGLFTGLTKNISPEMFSSMPIPYYIGLGLLSIIIVISWLVFYSLLRIASIKLIANYQESLGVKKLFLSGFNLIIPLSLISLLKNFFTVGGLMLFLIPGLTIAFLFQFTSFELILGNNRGLKAFKGSLQIASQHAGDILVRIILYYLAYYLIFSLPMTFIRLLIKLIFKSAPELALTLQFGLTFINIILAVIIGLFGLSYLVTLYKQAKAVTNTQKETKLTWVWIVAILGWLLMVILSIGSYKLLKGKATNYLQSKKSAPNLVRNPNYWLNQMKPEAKALYDQSQEIFKQLNQIATDPEKIKPLADQNIGLLIQASHLDPDNPQIWYQLGSAYTWPNTKGNYQDSLEAYQKAETLEPNNVLFINGVGDILILLGKYNEAVLQFQKTLRLTSNSGYAHLSLGIAYNRLKMPESAKTHLEKAISIYTAENKNGQYDDEILKARKEMEGLITGGAVISPTPVAKVTSSPSCHQYNIREGEFASNKCYSQKDYDDLIYYLQRFNLAVSSYNGAVASMNITCDGSDFFKNSCERAKQQKQQAETDMNNYRATIQGIIAKGK